MKVIFLDIDGVLNTPYWNRQQYAKNKERFARVDFYFQPSCVKQLKRIIMETDAKIVISSCWRFNEERIAVIEANLVWNGINPTRIIGITPKECGGERGTEIYKWLEDYNSNSKNTDKISNFVIIDDDSDMGDLIPFLVKCAGFWGLTKKIANKAIQILNPFKK